MNIYYKKLIKLPIVIYAVLFSIVTMADYSIAIGYEPKYSDSFRNFDYVNTKSKQGGTIKLSAFGTFESLNPFLLKSLAPTGLTNLVFETLMERSLDEPSSSYGHIASKYRLSEDKLSVIYYIKDNAYFSNGDEITAKDVEFSYKTLVSKDAHPQYKIYWSDIKDVIVLDRKSIKFIFNQKNPELHMIIGDIPIFSKKWFDGKTFSESILDKPIASGPYIVSKYETGRFVEYKKNPDYWARNESTRIGMFNFEKIIFKYYKDMTVALEAFKAGEYDYIYENHSKRWARDYNGPNFSNDTIIKTELEHMNNAGIQGFIFNTRKKIFQSKEVRKAITLAFDFNWSNKNLFYNQYKRCESYFSNSELSGNLKPTLDEINLAKKLYIPLSKVIEKDSKFIYDSSENNRKNLYDAKKIFDKLGWSVKNEILYDETNTKVEFDFLLAQKGFERILAPFAKNLKKLGIKLNYRTIDLSLYQRRVDSFDFDMMVMSYPQSQSPGNELISMFHSSSSQSKGAYNVGGISDQYVDILLEEIIYSSEREDMITAAKLLDRLLWNEFYMLPNWYISTHRIAYFNKFKQPRNLPKYYEATNYVLKTWSIK
tara:strand:- start:623 stop:2413 length:1791 start_codon:yes stop_codon:yes gene_type:complete